MTPRRRNAEDPAAADAALLRQARLDAETRAHRGKRRRLEYCRWRRKRLERLLRREETAALDLAGERRCP